jgi:hypothetical protein
MVGMEIWFEHGSAFGAARVGDDQQRGALTRTEPPSRICG